MNTSDLKISELLYKNVYTLTKALPPSKEFEKHFKEGMFDKPNTIGFIHVSHYLLHVYNEEYFRSNVEWPLFDKRSEAKYRSDVKDFMAIVADENKDLEFPLILTSHLMTAGGKKFLTLMFKLSQAALRSFLKKNGIIAFAKPKATHPVAKVLLQNSMARQAIRVKELTDEANKVENQGKEYAKKAIEATHLAEQNLLEERQNLSKAVGSLKSINDDVKRRLLNLNDNAVIEEWNLSINLSMQRVHQKLARAERLAKKSNEVNSLVKSLCSDGRKVLDGKNLPIIDAKSLVERLLDPEVQVALENLYVDGKLHLNSMFCVLASVLNYYKINVKLLHSPHFAEYNQQIVASTEDVKVMIPVIDTMQKKVMELLSEAVKLIASSQSQYLLHQHMDDEIFHSDVLKHSPTIHLKNYEPGKSDVLERLQLTPVEHPQREILTRYAAHNDFMRSNLVPDRPKLTITRINFDDTLPSTSRDEAMMNISRRPAGQTAQSIEARVGSRMADIIRGKRGNLSNLKTLANSWRTSSLLDVNKSGTVHSIYDQRQNGSTTSLVNSLELTTPPRGSSISGNMYAIRNIGKPTFNSTVSDLMTIAESHEINMNLKDSEAKNLGERKVRNSKEVETRNLKESEKPKDYEKIIEDGNKMELDKKEVNNIERTAVSEKKKRKEKSNRRFSIGDLMERYKKIRDQSTCLPDLNFDPDNFTE